jgi:ribosome biogenesis GTPase / thiamine phosphate phosphatase
MQTATVIRIEGPAVILRTDGGESLRATLLGRFRTGPRKTTHPVAVGDRVEVGSEDSQSFVIRKVSERKNLLARADAGDPRRCQPIAANIDQILCLQAFHDPELNLRSLDRFLLLAAGAGVPARIVVNKLDLLHGPEPPGLDAYPAAGYQVIRISIRSGRGLDEVGACLVGMTTVLIGSSGVGKSSLLNALVPGLHLRTGAVSRATSRGVHTTVRVEWIDLPTGGVVLDTPGLRAVRPWGLGPDNLALAFPELRIEQGCQFAGCRHVREAGCAVRAAVEHGRVAAIRYDSYLRILASLEDGGRGGRGDCGRMG